MNCAALLHLRLSRQGLLSIVTEPSHRQRLIAAKVTIRSWADGPVVFVFCASHIHRMRKGPSLIASTMQANVLGLLHDSYNINVEELLTPRLL